MGKRTQFEEMVLGKALAFKSGNNGSLLDHLESGDLPDSLALKNVCAKVSPALADELDEVCGLLSISKRRFIEASLIEALSKAKAIIYEDADIFEHVQQYDAVEFANERAE